MKDDEKKTAINLTDESFFCEWSTDQKQEVMRKNRKLLRAKTGSKFWRAIIVHIQKVEGT